MIVAVLLWIIAACGGEPEPQSQPRALQILLVNEEGWRAPGITVLRDELRRAGHRVVEVAPTVDRRGAGASATLAGKVVAYRPSPDPDVWTTTGTPADAALMGRGLMGAAVPDLVVSGVSPRPNTGLGTLHSGTIGAALTAAETGHPSIAVSADIAGGTPRAPDFAAVAEFTVRLVSTLQQSMPEGILLPDRTVLNVNYPRGPEAPTGVVVAPTSDAAVNLTWIRGADGLPIAVTGPPVPTGRDDDITALSRGEIVLTDLSADPDRATPPARAAARLAPLLRP